MITQNSSSYQCFIISSLYNISDSVTCDMMLSHETTLEIPLFDIIKKKKPSERAQHVIYIKPTGLITVR